MVKVGAAARNNGRTKKSIRMYSVQREGEGDRKG